MKAIEQFCAYSHKDKALRDRLDDHFSLLRKEGLIKHFYDRQIGPGQEWRDVIDEHLNSSQIILLLVSANFINSEYCYAVEMRRAMERHEAGEAIVVPVILKPCDWHTAPFGKLQALPREKAITQYRNRDEACLSVISEIRSKVLSLQGSRAMATAAAAKDKKELDGAAKLLLSFEPSTRNVLQYCTFSVSGPESAINIVIQPWTSGDYYLVFDPSEIPAVHAGDPVKATVHVYRRSGENSLVDEALMDYLGKVPGQQLEIAIIFENFTGTRFKRMFVLKGRALKGRIDCFLGGIEWVS